MEESETVLPQSILIEDFCIHNKAHYLRGVPCFVCPHI